MATCVSLLLLLFIIRFSTPSCTDNVYCSPPIRDDIAQGITPISTSTCGTEGPEDICPLGSLHSCDTCTSNESHPPSFMTDGRADSFWRSQTYNSIRDGVNITLSLGKTHYVEEISIQFLGLRPESFRLLVSDNGGSSFEPLQYFSQSCQETYGIQPSDVTTVQPPAPDTIGHVPLCITEGTEITPLSGGAVTYMRPSGAPRVIASDIVITLDRLNTLGNELVQAHTYFYTVSSLTVRGGCFCNGHADTCSIDNDGGLSCDCQHNTAGIDCEQCLPSHNDLPWQPLEEGNGDTFSCKGCRCGGLSDECDFNPQVYLHSGNRTGGICANCTNNTAGNNCELCAEGYYPQDPDDTDQLVCLACVCDPRGILGGDGTCETATQIYIASGSLCPCKANVEGGTCNRCRPGHHTLMTSNTDGCQVCECDSEGSLGSVCHPQTGQCSCKRGYYGINCLPCGCDEDGAVSIAECDSEGRCQCGRGFGGDKCDSCLPEYYNTSLGSCSECDCSSSGSLSTVCDESTGQCMCKPGYSGRDCSVCPDGFHDSGRGCTECPLCYQSISEDYQSVNNLLMELILQTNQTLRAFEYDPNLIAIVTDTRRSLEELLQLVRNLTQREMLLEMAVNETSTALNNKTSRLSHFTEIVHNALISTNMGLHVANSTVSRVDDILNLHRESRLVLSLIEANLTTASRYLNEIISLRESLAGIGNESAILSMEQTRTVESLLFRSNILLDNTTDIVNSVCESTQRENATLTQLTALSNCTLSDLDQLVVKASTYLRNAVSNSSEVLNRSIGVRDTVLNILVPEYNADELLLTVQSLIIMTASQREGLDSLSNRSTVLRNALEIANISLIDLQMRIVYLESTAINLRDRSRLALLVANVSVVSAENVIQEIDSLLAELERRLNELQIFLNRYNSLVEVVRTAENVSENALTSSTEQLLEVERIVNVTADIDAVLQRALDSLETTVKILDQANSTALSVLNSALTINATVEGLPSQLDEASESIEALVRRATNDQAAIKRAESIVDTTRQRADTLEEDLERVDTALEQLLKDVDNVTLVSEARYLRFKNNVNTLETVSNRVEESLGVVEGEVARLEDQSKLMEERYSEIRRHIDLLKDIRANVEGLDCNDNIIE